MNPDHADAMARAPAAYVHIPFCSAICPYCDFAVVAGRDELSERYVSAVCREIEMCPSWLPLKSVYFGGGTPSRLEARHLARILAALQDRHGLASGAEISLEANPEDFTAEKAEGLFASGFNRVSFGAQSLDRKVLGALGRRHSPDQVRTSVRAARDAGFTNVSVDLIFGTPEETDEAWEKSVSEVISLLPDHVSAYALTVERGTPLGRAVAHGAAAPDPDTQADRYELADRMLGAAGFSRYEVSNWARPGFECRYNLTVWAQGEYEAYGNGAHGFRDGVRFRNHRRIDAYMDRVESGDPARAGEERLSGWEAEVDRVFVGMRRTVGVRPGKATDLLLESPEGARLMSAGILAVEDDRVRVLRPLMTDAVHRSVLALDAPIVLADGNA